VIILSATESGQSPAFLRIRDNCFFECSEKRKNEERICLGFQ
jgi:hypothetical protein